MTLARWKDLCLDAADPERLGGFWAGVLRLDLQMQEDGDAVLRGTAPEQTVWVNRVAEPKTTKNRVHLDLARVPLDELVGAGARAVQQVHYGSYRWTVLTGLEGEELCAFPVDDGAPSALVVDSAGPVTDAAWWADVLGGRLLEAPGGLPRWVDVPGLPFDVLKFVGVEEPKTVKNRVHWDVTCSDIAALVARGAEILRAPDDVVSWHVLADPAGNEFCAFPP